MKWITRLLALCMLAGMMSWTVPLANASPSGSDDDLVYTVEVKASQGNSASGASEPVDVTVSEYLLAPGVTARQLHNKLKDKGVKGLVEPGTRLQDAVQSAIAQSVPSGVPPEPRSGCSYGTSQTIACPAPRWARNGFVNPRVYFYDQSSAAWPVGTAISRWNQSPKIAPRWAPSGCPAEAGSHCVWVNSGGYGASGWLGRTMYSWNTSTLYFYDGTVGIQLNDYYVPTSRTAVACHEVGHALGLGHAVSSSSCMISVDPTSNYPSSDDFWILANALYY